MSTGRNETAFQTSSVWLPRIEQHRVQRMVQRIVADGEWMTPASVSRALVRPVREDQLEQAFDELALSGQILMRRVGKRIEMKTTCRAAGEGDACRNRK